MGEQHYDSKFDEITSAWPGVAKMGEGNYMIHETDLALQQKDQDIGKKTLDKNMNSKNSDVLPLENFHTAAYARLMSYLVIINAHQHEKSDNSTKYIKDRAQDILNVVWAYLNVGVSAYVRGNADAFFGGALGGSYKRDLEKYYGEMYNLLEKNEANKAALETLDGLVKDNIAPDKMTSKQLNQLRNLIKSLIPKISLILKESTKNEDTKNSMITESGKVDKFVNEQGDNIRGKDMQASLDVVNPAREIYMKKQIGTLSKPSLVKVGVAHLGGLQKLVIPDAIYYKDYNEFYSGIKKKKDDL